MNLNKITCLANSENLNISGRIMAKKRKNASSKRAKKAQRDKVEDLTDLNGHTVQHNIFNHNKLFSKNVRKMSANSFFKIRTPRIGYPELKFLTKILYYRSTNLD